MAKKIYQVLSLVGLSILFVIFQNFTDFDAVTTSSNTLVVQVENFRNVSGKVLSDRQTVDAAFNEAIRLSATSKVRLDFADSRTYRLQRQLLDQTPQAIFNFINVNNIILNGNNALLVLNRPDYVAEIRGSSEIHIWNLKVDYAIPNHTQGVVISVDPLGNSFVMDIDQGYLLPQPNVIDWGNSLSFDNQERFLKDINIFIKSIQSLGSQRFKIDVAQGYEEDAKKLKATYKFAFRAFGDGGKPNFVIFSSKDVSFKNIDVYNTMKMGFTAHYNEGRLTFDDVRIKRRPGTNRLIAGLSDGFHIKSNRSLVTIKNSFVERILDDGVNLGSMALVCHSYNSSTQELELRETSYIKPGQINAPPLKVGDTLHAFHLGPNASNIFLGSAQISSIVPIDNRVRIVRMSTSIPGIVCLDPGTGVGVGGNDLTQMHATRFFSYEISNPGFRVLNNVFREKTRSGILGKARGGQIRGNLFDELSGTGISANNQLRFNEGPPPLRMEISANTFKNIQLSSVILGISSQATADVPTMDVNSDIVNNEFIGGLPLRLMNANGINIAGNIYTGTDESQSYIKNVPIITNEPATALFKLGTGYYFEGPGYICKYVSMNQVAKIWGANFNQWAAPRTQFPTARHVVGDCFDDEGVSKLVTGAIIRKTRIAQEVCNWGSTKRLHLGTGISNASLMGAVTSQNISQGVCSY